MLRPTSEAAKLVAARLRLRQPPLQNPRAPIRFQVLEIGVDPSKICSAEIRPRTAPILEPVFTCERGYDLKYLRLEPT